MAEFEKDDFHFPDETPEKETKVDIELDGEGAVEIEIEDDTPEDDRGRRPADPEKVKALEVEVDDLDKYSKDAKDKLIRMKRVWNDERRRADAADRERQAALDAAQRLLAENNRIKGMLQNGEAEYKEAVQNAAKAQLNAAKKELKDAHEAGDSEALVEAQEKLFKAQVSLDRAEKFKLPPLQAQETVVQSQETYQAPPRPDNRVMQWQAENPWFGQDEEMTASALGLHEKLKRQGVEIGSEDYYAALDSTMRKRFPENFGDEEVETKRKADVPKAKSPTNVAPATRSTAPKRVVLTRSQVAIAKKLGLSPEQYVRELMKLEA